MRLKDRIAVVTGGGSGIGRATCELFAREGARVVVVDINADGGRETVSLIEKSGKPAVFIEADVSIEENAKKIVDTAVSEFGGVNILVNNAAAFILKDLSGVTVEDWARIIGVNVRGPSFCIRQVVPEMRKAGGGAIVNIASVAGMMALPKHMPYAPAKAALIMMTRSLAQELGPHNIRVNSLAPGGTLTPAVYVTAKEWNMSFDDIVKGIGRETFLNRFAEPVEIAYGALFLASDESSYVTGTNLVVDGGLSAH